MTKRLMIVSIAVLMIIVVGLVFRPFHYFYGFVDIQQLDRSNDEYIVEISGEFGKRLATFNEEDLFEVIENNESREDNIVSIWDHLSEGETYHVLVEVHEKKGPFTLEKIYIDQDG